MVKNIIALLTMGLLGSLLVMSGCNQSSPAYPKDMSALVLKVPMPAGSAGVSSSTVALNQGLLRYRIASGNEIVDGTIEFDYTKNLGTVHIPLPHDGTWLVSAEWFETGYYGSAGYGTPGNPRFIGADLVNVAGTTNFSLLLGDMTLSGCSSTYMADPSSCAGYADLFTFDSATSGYTNNGDTAGDIQLFYDGANATEYFGNASGSHTVFAYLGTGDWLNYVNVPDGTQFFDNSELAKQHVLGKDKGAMDYNDVYVVKLNPTTLAWVQVRYVNYCGGGYLYMNFRVNSQGLPYMKYQATTYGLANCTNLYYYGGCCGG